jgi:hypothetical protein
MYDYISHNKLSAHPMLQLCYKDTTCYMAPLSKQKDFFVDDVDYESIMSAS